ncbi:hypothetical protein D3Q05_24050, partial [Salmonella enterica]|nr:hypothetical protein [Salmonella enterica]EBN9469226.1 hypothetical protein [Salmonella enterica]ECA6104254.1 hypothetical protein [Salmonella enterica subsp. enterica serovar Oranienburg]
TAAVPPQVFTPPRHRENIFQIQGKTFNHQRIRRGPDGHLAAVGPGHERQGLKPVRPRMKRP